jgi:hypothetical protein
VVGRCRRPRLHDGELADGYGGRGSCKRINVELVKGRETCEAADYDNERIYFLGWRADPDQVRDRADVSMDRETGERDASNGGVILENVSQRSVRDGLASRLKDEWRQLILSKPSASLSATLRIRHRAAHPALPREQALLKTSLTRHMLG